jgi:hypothetical protein
VALTGPPVRKPRRSASRPVWFDACLLGISSFLIFAASADYHDPLNNDTRADSIAAWQLAFHGNATLTAFHDRFAWLFTVHGRDITDRMPGTVFWGAPFYRVLGHASAPDVYPGALAAVTAAAMAVALAYVVCAKLVSRPTAACAALFLAFGTATWTVSADQLWTHGPAQAAVLLIVLLCSQRRWLVAGIPAGFAILVRPHLGVVALVFGCAEALRRKSLRPLLIGVGSAAGAAVLLAYEHSLWGRLIIFGGYDQPVAASGIKFARMVTGLVGDLVSPERGLLVFTPALVLLLPGLRRAWVAAPPWARTAAGAGLAYLGLQLWGIRFTGGDGFYSYRTTLETLTLFVPLLALAWQEWTAKTRLRRTAFAALAAVSVSLQAFGAVVNWSPGGENHDPRTTFNPVDLAHHVGAAQTGAWLAVAVAVTVAAAVLTWNRGGSVKSSSCELAGADAVTV